MPRYIQTSPQNHTQVIQNVHGVLSIKRAVGGKGAFPANVVQLHMVPKRVERKVAMKLQKVDGKFCSKKYKEEKKKEGSRIERSYR